MSKWADYGISAVRYDNSNTHIVEVKIREDKGDSMGGEETVARETVVTAIENGTTFVTVLSKDGKLVQGEDVFVVKINNAKYIKTTSNNVADDNLGSLPTF